MSTRHTSCLQRGWGQQERGKQAGGEAGEGSSFASLTAGWHNGWNNDNCEHWPRRRVSSLEGTLSFRVSLLHQNRPDSLCRARCDVVILTCDLSLSSFSCLLLPPTSYLLPPASYLLPSPASCLLPLASCLLPHFAFYSSLSVQLGSNASWEGTTCHEGRELLGPSRQIDDRKRAIGATGNCTLCITWATPGNVTG